MKKQFLDLKQMGLIPMDNRELMEVDGGSIWKWILGGVGAVVGFLVGGVEGAIYGAGLGFMVGASFDGDGSIWVSLGIS